MDKAKATLAKARDLFKHEGLEGVVTHVTGRMMLDGRDDRAMELG